MADGVTTDIAEIALPFGRRALLKDVAFESGLKMLRLVLREGRRITIVDMDPAGAADLARHMGEWAGAHGAGPDAGAP